MNTSQPSPQRRKRRGVILAFCLLTQLAGWAVAEKPPTPALSYGPAVLPPNLAWPTSEIMDATQLPKPKATNTPLEVQAILPAYSAKPPDATSSTAITSTPKTALEPKPSPPNSSPTPTPTPWPTTTPVPQAIPNIPTPAPIPSPAAILAPSAVPAALPLVAIIATSIPPTPPPVASTKALTAVAWAQAELHSGDPAWSNELQTPWSGYCEAFVEIAYGTRYRYPSALTNYHAQVANGNLHTDTKPPIGALVFYGGGTYGHVALSLGNGQVITTWGQAGQRYALRQIALLNLSNPYLGWSNSPYP